MDKYSTLINQVNYYYDNCLAKIAFIKKVKDKWRVVSRKGKNLGEYKSKSEAKKRLKEIEFFKHKKASRTLNVKDLSLSAIMRELRKRDEKIAEEFLKVYKKCFDFLICNEIENVEEVCLENAVNLFKKLHNIKLEKAAMNIYANSNAQMVGQYLANIVKFTLSRISNERRPKSIESLKHKIYQLNESELANKKLPASASMGQAITFIKHVLFNRDPQYIRQVLNSIILYL